jgi:phosphate acetyltransferase
MARSLYIAAIEPRSGKSIVALGIMELLSRRMRKLGYFRPVVPSAKAPDNNIRLIQARYNNIRLIQARYNLNLAYEDLFVYTHEAAQNMSADGQTDIVLKNILKKFKELERKCNFILCEGTDFTGVSSAFEFDFNAIVANNSLVNGRFKSVDDILDAVHVAEESFEDKGCTVLATIVNRVDPEKIGELGDKLDSVGSNKEPLYILPEVSALGKPTVGDVANALNAQIMQGEAEELNREVHDFKVAAMNLPNFLDRIAEGDLIITPGDRADVILGCLSATVSETYPTIAGLLLSGGFRPEVQIQRLLEGFRKQFPVPVICVDSDTYTTALNASTVRPVLSPENDRKIAAALGTFENHVDLKKLEERINVVRSKRVTPIMFEYELIERAKADRRHIVLPEGEEERILRASEILLRRDVVDVTLLGNPDKIKQKIGSLGLNLETIRIIDPFESDLLKRYAQIFYELRKHKDISQDMAIDTMSNVNYFGTMMVHTGEADGMVSGSIHTTGDTIRPALQIIRTRPGFTVVSSVFLMCLADRVLVYGDCAVNPDPNAEQLADIAISSAETAEIYGIEPRIAMCSYSTGESGSGKDVDKVRKATRIARERRADLKIEGPIQYDAAVDAGVARTKLPESEVAGKATVFIFPDLSRGCTIADIVNTVAITAIQAQAVNHSSLDSS